MVIASKFLTPTLEEYKTEYSRKKLTTKQKTLMDSIYACNLSL